MWRELNGSGLNGSVALRKPLISKTNLKKRLQFAREHKDWTLEQWKKVMRSDESTFMVLSWLPEYTGWPRSSTNGFFLPWWHGHIPRWQCQDSSGSNCERVVQGAWDIIFTHGLATTESRPLPHWESLGCAGEGFAQWSNSPIIKTRSWRKMNATLDGNKSCDIAEAYWKTMPHRMHAVIKAKGGPTKY